MTASQIVGYWLARKVEQSEIPSTMPHKAREVVGLLGSGDMLYMIPPGINVLELGLIMHAGRYMLIPHGADGLALWPQAIDLLLTPEQAAIQCAINERLYLALLAHLPLDAPDLHAGVIDTLEQDRSPGILNVVRRATVAVWTEERRRSEPLDDAERDRLDAAVGIHALGLLRAMSPRGRLDRESLRPLLQTHLGCHWDRILVSVAEGDYEDAAVRVLARIKIGRNVTMPTSCILQVLPGVERLDLCFVLLRNTTEHPGAALYDWLQRSSLGADPAAAELAVRVLFAAWRMELHPVLARSVLRRYVPRIQCEPISADARLIRRWLATVHRLDGRGEERRSDEIAGAVERWDRALRTTIDEIIMSLPERAAQGAGSPDSACASSQ